MNVTHARERLSNRLVSTYPYSRGLLLAVGKVSVEFCPSFIKFLRSYKRPSKPHDISDSDFLYKNTDYR